MCGVCVQVVIRTIKRAIRWHCVANSMIKTRIECDSKLAECNSESTVKVNAPTYLLSTGYSCSVDQIVIFYSDAPLSCDARALCIVFVHRNP